VKSRPPPLSRIIAIWVTLTACAVIGFVIYSHGRAPDELVMANTWGFQIVVALLFVGVPAVMLLIACLLVGSLIWCRRPTESLLTVNPDESRNGYTSQEPTDEQHPL
jgi:hypothetical protein